MTYQIKETREFFGPQKVTSLICDYFGNPESFATKVDAEARIEELCAAPYTTAHNESTRPDYKVVKA